MRKATDEHQNIVVFGGTSEIALAIVTELVTPTTRHVVLACRNTAAGELAVEALDLPSGCSTHVVAWDATALFAHVDCVGSIAGIVGNLDVVVMAAGVLGTQAEFDDNPTEAGHAVVANMAGPVATLAAAANSMRPQRHGQIVVLSSVAGIRVRAANHVYGSTKAGLDAYAQGLADHLAGTGVKVTIVRPGFVAGRMTSGMKRTPFATTPAAVAANTARAINRSQRIVHSPRILRWVFLILRHLPVTLWRRISD